LDDWTKEFAAWADFLFVAMNNGRVTEVCWLLDGVDSVQRSIELAQDTGALQGYRGGS